MHGRKGHEHPRPAHKSRPFLRFDECATLARDQKNDTFDHGRFIFARVFFNLLQMEGNASAPVCWICLCHRDANGRPPRKVCRCSPTHLSCVQRWVEVSGRSRCNVCLAPYRFECAPPHMSHTATRTLAGVGLGGAATIAILRVASALRQRGASRWAQVGWGIIVYDLTVSMWQVACEFLPTPPPAVVALDEG